MRSIVCKKKGKLAARAGLAAFVAVVLLHAGLFIYRTQDAWPALWGSMDPHGYLATHERSFKGYHYLNEIVGPDQKVFNFAEIRRFYQGSYTMITEMPALLIDLKAHGVTLGDYLSKLRFDYLWVDPKTMSGEWGPWIRENYEEAFSYDFTEAPATFHYSILRLKGSVPGAV